MIKHKNRNTAGMYSRNNASQRRYKDFYEISSEKREEMLEEIIFYIKEGDFMSALTVHENFYNRYNLVNGIFYYYLDAFIRISWIEALVQANLEIGETLSWFAYDSLAEVSERDEEGVYREDLTKMKQRFIKAHDGHIIVVDATDGPMPETREQISAARRKNLSNLVVVLNICDSDFDDEEMLELEELEMRELLDEYEYDGDNTPIIRVSNFEEYSRQEQSVRSTQPQNNDYSESLNKGEKADYSQNTVHKTSTRQDIEAKYKEIIVSLNDALEDLNNNWSSNSSLNELNNNVIELLKKEITNAKSEMDASLHAVSWDNLVIAFFGETNAGKSTIIETFRILFDSKRPKNNDGMIVGDGQSDFTKDYNEYPLEIDGKRFTLIDVPGIEGNEKEYSDKIQTALRKAHCVFYVQGHNKKPDEATAKKIKKYLGDWVNVYSIQNIRGGVSNYDEEEERKELLTEYVRKNEKLIKETFTKILGNEVYKGNIPLQALLAMCAKATFSSKREDLVNNQKKLLRYFGNADNILSFSQFQTIINIVKYKSENFIDEIIEANRTKLMSLARNISIILEQMLDNQQNEIKQFKEEMRNCNRIVQQAFDNIRNFLNNKKAGIVDEEFNRLKQDIFRNIDTFNDKDQIKSSVNRLVNDFPKKLDNRLKSEQQKAIRNLKEKIRKATSIIETFNKTIPIEVTPDHHSLSSNYISNDLEELDVSLADFLNSATTFLGTATIGASIGSLIGPLGTIIGGIVGGIVGGMLSFFSSDRGKPEAKKEISKTLDEEKRKIISNINNENSGSIHKLNKMEKELSQTIRVLRQHIDRIGEVVDDVVNNMNMHISTLKTI